MEWYEHGGKRKGSGRKKRPKPEIINLRVTPELKEAIEKEAEEEGISVNKCLINILVAHYVLGGRHD